MLKDFVSSKKQMAAFTIVQNESYFLDMWVKHYSKTIPKRDLYILDHDSKTKDSLEAIERHEKNGVNVEKVHNDFSFDHNWLRDQVQAFQDKLLGSYDVVLFAEADEIIMPRPDRHHYGLKPYVMERFKDKNISMLTCFGKLVQHDHPNEPDLDLSRLFFDQRFNWSEDNRFHGTYNKCVISKVPLKWDVGFHALAGGAPSPPIDHELFLIHLHCMDYRMCKKRHEEQASRNWSRSDIEHNMGFQNRIFEGEAFENMFYPRHVKELLTRIPDYMRGTM